MKTALAFALLLAACNKDADNKPAPTGTRFDIAVTEKGFEPNDVNVPAGKPITLVFDRKTDQTCIKQVVIKMADGSKIERDLPRDTPVEVAATFPIAGKVTYVCGMDMETGTITVQ